MKNNQKSEKIQKIKNLFISDKKFKKIIDQIAESQNERRNNNDNKLKSGMTSHAGRSLLQETKDFLMKEKQLENMLKIVGNIQIMTQRLRYLWIKKINL